MKMLTALGIPSLGNSNIIQTVLVFVAAISLIRLLVDYVQKVRRLPPGPWGNHIPIVGYLPFLVTAKKHPPILLGEMAKTYGPIFSLKLGGTLQIVITDPKLVREAFKRDDLSNRTQQQFVDDFIKGHGIVTSNGELWRTQRQFTYGVLRDLGMLRKTSSDKVCFEQNAQKATAIFLTELEQLSGQTFGISPLVGFTVINTIFATIMTKTFELYDANLMTIINEMTESFKIIDEVALVNFFPVLSRLPRFKKISDTLRERNKTCLDFLRIIVEEHRQTLDPNEPRDLIDSFLVEMGKDKTAGTQNYFTEFQLLMVLADLISAGLETTRTTILWLLLVLIKYPNIQDKIQDEIDTVIGRNRSPSLNDRAHLHYLERTILETHRFSSVLALGAPHAACNDLVFEGYSIPKGTNVMGIPYMLHRDKKYWKNPHEFDPDNFLGEDGSIQRPEAYMPFSTGKRACIGQDFANNEIFIICSNVLQKFRILPPEGEEVPELESDFEGVLAMPRSYKLRVVPRF